MLKPNIFKIQTQKHVKAILHVKKRYYGERHIRFYGKNRKCKLRHQISHEYIYKPPIFDVKNALKRKNIVLMSRQTAQTRFKRSIHPNDFYISIMMFES